MAYMRLGDILVASGVINEQQLGEALAMQKKQGSRLGDVLIGNGFITEEQLINALRMQLGIDYADLSAINIPVELAKYVPRTIARNHCVVPVKLVKDNLYIAMSDPLDFVAQEQIKYSSRKRVIPMISSKRATEQAIAMLYGGEGTARAIEEMKMEADGGGGDVIPAQMREIPEENAAAAPTIRFVNSIISRAINERASDIHLEPQDGEMAVRMRIDGLLRKILTVPSNLQPNIISRLKVMCGMKISERKVPQDGHADITVGGRDIDLRVSTMPTVYGEKAVLRILDKSAQLMNKSGLGLTADDLEKYNRLLRNTGGVILLVGPTGSGKSTTLCAMISELATEEVNVETLEDPVEYNIPGVCQCQINEATGMTFAKGLRAMLRQDPDIIAVGEIRDGETASIAIRAAITGHLVLSTLHTNDAVSAVFRLKDIGVEPYMISSSLRGVISQRLVRKLCPDCRMPYKPGVEEKEALGIPPEKDVTFYKGIGCRSCSHTGYTGRQGVFEILMINSRIKEAITGGASYEFLNALALENGFVTLKDNCRRLVESGVISYEEAMRAINTTVD